jgi:hypothetical protein
MLDGRELERKEDTYDINTIGKHGEENIIRN